MTMYIQLHCEMYTQDVHTWRGHAIRIHYIAHMACTLYTRVGVSVYCTRRVTCIGHENYNTDAPPHALTPPTNALTPHTNHHWHLNRITFKHLQHHPNATPATLTPPHHGIKQNYTKIGAVTPVPRQGKYIARATNCKRITTCIATDHSILLLTPCITQPYFYICVCFFGLYLKCGITELYKYILYTLDMKKATN